jgi:protein-S-isoprenylcysteine O-methyltransferase Ste14
MPWRLTMRGSTSPARSRWPRIGAFLLLMLLLAGAVYHVRSASRLPVWIEIVGFLAISSTIAALIEWGGKSDRGR